MVTTILEIVVDVLRPSVQNLHETPIALAIPVIKS